MKKMVGYVVAFAGLAVMLVGFGTFKIDAAIFDIIKPGMITTIGVVGVIVGVAFLMMDRKSNKHGKQKDAEVPIYHGEEIVGYRRHSN